ncbi:MAG: hypothetical protein WBE97_01355, partial [Candidatus Acidiferrales bacterium]
LTRCVRPRSGIGLRVGSILIRALLANWPMYAEHIPGDRLAEASPEAHQFSCLRTKKRFTMCKFWELNREFRRL